MLDIAQKPVVSHEATSREVAAWRIDEQCDTFIFKETAANYDFASNAANIIFNATRHGLRLGPTYGRSSAAGLS